MDTGDHAAAWGSRENWAPHAFMRMAFQHETYAEEARALVEQALSDPAPSVRARARKTLESM